jgi:hypothetical protein
VGVGVGFGMRYFFSSRMVLSERILWYFTRPGSTRWKMSKKSLSRKCADPLKCSHGMFQMRARLAQPAW